MRKVVRLGFIAIAVFSRAGEAARFELLAGGEPVPGAQVCMFDAEATRDPVRRLTTIRNVVCHPADAEVPVPRGIWNVFARAVDRAEPLVSPDLALAVDGAISRTSLHLVEAVPLSLDDSAPSRLVAAYVDETGAVLPALPEEKIVLVPKGSRIFPLWIDEARVIRIGEPVHAGDEPAKRVIFAEPKATRDLVVGLAPDARAFAAIDVRGRDRGSIEMTPAGTETRIRSANEGRAAFEGRPALALFRDVASEANEGSVLVAGEGWYPSSVRFDGDAISGALRIAPTTMLDVIWSIRDDVLAVQETIATMPECPRDPKRRIPVSRLDGARVDGPHLTLHACPGLQPGSREPRWRAAEECSLVASAVLLETERGGRAVLSGVPPGLYLLRIGWGELPGVAKTIEVLGPDAVTEIELAFDRWFGRVTRAREPVHAFILLGEGAVSDPRTGEFIAFASPTDRIDVSRFPERDTGTKIQVIGCTDRLNYDHVLERPPEPNTRVDIEIPENELRIAVVDRDTGQGVPDAKIDFGALARDDEGRGIFGYSGMIADADGRLTLRNVTTNRKLRVCARHPEYDSTCADPFEIGTAAEREVTIPLRTVVVRAGKVHAPVIERGEVMWYTETGVLTELVSVARDGTFQYRKEHQPGELAFIVSATTPLHLVRVPPLGHGETFEIRYPAAPVRDYELVLPPGVGDDGGLVGINLGAPEIAVPVLVLQRHAMLRGAATSWAGPGVLTLSDILASAPVSFTFAPWSLFQLHGVGRIDFFATPAGRSLPRVHPDADGRAVLRP